MGERHADWAWPNQVGFEDRSGTERVVDIVMTTDEWDDTTGVMWGSFDDAAEAVKERVLGLEPHERFLVDEQYELVPSATPHLPVDAESQRLHTLARLQHEGFGTWSASSEDGT